MSDAADARARRRRARTRNSRSRRCPASSEASSTSTLTGVPVSASIEPACAPKTSGISSCEGGRLSRTARTTTTGSSAATAPLTLISAESTPQKQHHQHDQPRAAVAPAARQHLPGPGGEPVFSSAALTTKSEATKIVAGSPKPASALVEREHARRPERHRAADADRDDRQPVPDEQADDRGDDGEDDPDLGQESPRLGTGGRPAVRARVAQFTCQRNRGPAMLAPMAASRKSLARLENIAAFNHSTNGGRHDGEATGIRASTTGPRAAFSTASSPAIERVGNKVPHPAIIFFILIGLVIVLSVILSLDRLVGDLRGDRPGDPRGRHPDHHGPQPALRRRHPLHLHLDRAELHELRRGRRHHRRDDRRRRRRGIRPDRHAGAQDRRDRAEARSSPSSS